MFYQDRDHPLPVSFSMYDEKDPAILRNDIPVEAITVRLSKGGKAIEQVQRHIAWHEVRKEYMLTLLQEDMAESILWICCRAPGCCPTTILTGCMSEAEIQPTLQPEV